MNSSANRGSCLQTCRRAYTVTDKETGAELEIDNEYIMSPKDLKTIHFLDKILDAGVSVLKIEGRARSAEYVKTTVQCYREAVEAYFDNSFTRKKWKTGITGWHRFLTVVSGMVTIWGSGWASGVKTTVRWPQNENCTLASAPIISIKLRLPNLNLKPQTLKWAMKY
jgi:hypothetical protein